MLLSNLTALFLKEALSKWEQGEKFPLTLDSSSLDTLKARLSNFRLILEVIKTKHTLLSTQTFQGNSGSPVINTLNNLVEGILVRGEQILMSMKNQMICVMSSRCHEGECVGEKF